MTLNEGFFFQLPHKFPHDPVAHLLGVRELLDRGLEVIGQGLIRGQHLGVVFRQAVFRLEAA